MSNILSLENFDKALTRKKWDLKKLANEYDKKYPSENGKTIYNTLRKWRSPNGNPTLNILVRICDLLECDIDYLLGRIDPYYKIHSRKNRVIRNFSKKTAGNYKNTTRWKRNDCNTR